MSVFRHYAAVRRARNLIYVSLVALLGAATPLSAQLAPQTISFPTIPNQRLGVAPFPITAAASSHLAVSFSSTTPGACKTSGAWVLLLTTGSCSIQAVQSGGSGYSAANPVTNTFTISNAVASGTLASASGNPLNGGANAVGTAIADFNHDGYADIAIANNISGEVTILLGGASAFSSGTVTVPGDTPYAIAVGDFNHDGMPDLVTANTTNNTVSVLLANANGGFTFQSLVDVPVVTPSAIVVGDFDGDGLQDVAVAGQDGKIAVLQGDGAGGLSVFATSPFFASGAVYGMVAGDFNNDGHLDIAVIQPSINLISIYTGNGTGALSTFGSLNTGTNTSPKGITAGDFNGDGYTDLAVTLQNKNSVAIYLNNASGTLQQLTGPFTVGTSPVAVAVADFNGDGYQDLAVADSSSNGLYLLIGDGAGNFSDAGTQPEYSGVGSTPYIAVGDFNGDGREDIVTTSAGGVLATVFLGALAPATSTLTTTSPYTVAENTSVPLTLTVTPTGQHFSTVTGTVSFYDNESLFATVSSPPYAAARTVAFGSHTLTAIYSGTGGNAGSTSNSLAISALHNQTITFPALSDQAFNAQPQYLFASADSGLTITYTSNTQTVCSIGGGASPVVNVLTMGLCSITASQPGDSNYLPAQSVTNTFNIGKSNQTITFSFPNGIHYVGTAPFYAPASADSGLPVTITSDTPGVCKASGVLIQPISAGLCQLTATQSGNAQFNAAASMDAYAGVTTPVPSGQFSQGPLLTTGSLPEAAVVADFNGDGNTDIAVLNRNDHTVSIFSQNADGIFVPAAGSPLSAGNGADGIVEADFNGDGFPDLAVTSASSKTIDVLLSDAGYFPGVHTTITLSAAPGGLAVADFNNDGNLDFVVTEPSLGKILLYAGDGQGNFSALGSPITAGVNPGSVAVADFDGDGNADVVIADPASGAVVLRGNGTGGFTSMSGSPFAASAAPQFVSVADFNKDGSYDFVVSNPAGNTLTVLLWNGSGFTPGPSGSLSIPTLSGSLAVADFDGDNNIDIAVPDTAGVVHLLLGDGSGGFSPALNSFPTGSGIAAMVAFNSSNNGAMGIAAANPTGNAVTLLQGAQAAVSGSVTSATATTVSYGTPIDLTLSITPPAGAFRIPTGEVYFTDDATDFFDVAPETSSPWHDTISVPLPAGTHAIYAFYIGDQFTQYLQTAPITRTVTQVSQTISFSTLNDKPFGVAPFDIAGSASASSGLPITFSTTSTGVCSLNGSLVTLIGIGTCTIHADQGGDTNHLPAPTVSQSFAVTQGSQSITFRNIPNKVFGSAPFLVSAQSTAHLPVTIVSTTPSVCKTASTLVTLLTTGTCSIQATQPGNANVSAATTVTQSFPVIQSAPAGTLTPAPGGTIFAGSGAAPFAVVFGDFNNDGVADFATANDHTANVTVAIGAISGGNFSASYTNQYPVGNLPISIAAADFDGNGNLDLVTADQADGKLTILLNTGTGAFVPQAQRPAPGNGPDFVAAGDFNSDGIPDLAVTNSTDNSVVLLRGVGDGTFLPFGSAVQVGQSPDSIAVGDFNNDGKQDLAVANADTNNVYILLGDGAGGLTPHGSPLSAGTHPTSITVIDYDIDGKSDLAVSNLNDASVSLFHGDGLGSFTAVGTALTVGSGPAGIIAGDFNGDGHPDLATANFGGGVSILLGDGAGNFGLHSLSAGSQPAGLAEIDLNGDGFDDLAVANVSSSDVTILQGGLAATQLVLSTTSPLNISAGSTVSLTVNITNPGGSFSPPTGSLAIEDGSTTLGDFAQFSSPFPFTTPPLASGTHIITAFYSGNPSNIASVSNSLTFSAQSPQFITFSPLSDRPMSPLPFALTATSGSGLQVQYSTTSTACSVSGSMVTMLSIGQCSITAIQPGDSQYSAASPVTQSFNITIGSQTIVFGQNDSYLGASPSQFEAQATSRLPVTVTSLTPSVCRVASTLVIPVTPGPCTIQGTQSGNANYTPVTASVTIHIFESTQANRFVPKPDVSINASPYGIATADFNGDNIPDVVLANTSGSSVSLLLNDGHGGFQPAGNFATGPAPLTLAAADFNGDGFPDVVTANSDGTFSVLLGAGNGTLTPVAGGAFPANTHAIALAVGDFNSDGIFDLASASSGAVTVFTGNGMGGFTQASQTALSGTPVALTVGDFDNNGKQDIAAVDVANNRVFVLLGDATGHFTSAGSPVSVDTAPVAIAAGDFDADGNLDLAVANQGAGDVSVLIGDGLGGFHVGASPSAGTAPTGVIVGDFNGDGLADLGVGFSGGFAVLRNNGSLSFTQPTGSPFALTAPYSMVSGDFNNDGRPDVASISGANQLSVLLGATVTTSTLSTTSPPAVPLGTTVPFTLSVTETGYEFTLPTGSATLMEGATVVATATESSTPFSFSVAGLSPGTHTLAGHFTGTNGYVDSISNTITIDVQASQSISFAPLSDVPLTASSIQVSATATSALPVVFTSTTTSICTVNGTTVTLVSAGQCSITASQAGDSTWAPATNVTNSFNITSPQTQTISFDSIPPQLFGGSPIVVAAQSSSHLPVTIASLTPAVCKTASNLVTMVSGGTCQIRATQPGGSGFAAAPPVTRSFIVSAAKPGGTFSFGSPTSGGTSAQTAVIGDFNNDQLPDFAIADSSSTGKVTILLGTQGGGFTLHGTVNVGTSPGGIAVGDFNGDGKLDLVTADQGSNTATVLLGDGTGGFTPSTIQGFNSPAAVAVGDFNGDGIQDLAIANAGTNEITVEFGNGDGTFSIDDSGPFITGSQPRSIVVGDFNGDGKQDLSTANLGTDNVTVLLGNGAGSFTQASNSPFSVGTSPIQLVSGDFNNDGSADLAVAISGIAGDISVLVGNGQGNFTVSSLGQFGSSPFQSLAVGDYNGDGKPDIAAAGYASSGPLYVFFGDGAGGFTVSPTTYGIGQYATSLLAADLTGDGIIDLAVVTNGDGSLRVMTGTQPAQSPQTITFQPISSVLVGANVDLVASSTSGLTVTFSSSTTQVCTVSGTTATAIASGTCTILASQAGNANYAPASTSQSFAVTSPAPPPPPPSINITTTSLPTGVVNQIYGPVPLAVSGSSGLLSWSVTSGGLPTGISLGGNGTLSGTPTASGTFAFTVTVSDSNGASASGGLSITISPALSITTSTLPNGVINVSYSQTLSASGGTGSFSWSLKSGTPPTGIGLSSNGSVSGTPTAAGTFSFTAQVSDGVSTASQGYSISITSPITITSSTLPNGATGAAYNASLAAKGGNGGPYTWSLASGSLPPGIGLGANGLLSGNPSAAGAFTFSVRASDGVSPPVSGSVSITIFGALSITTTSLPDGVAGKPYGPESIAAKGGSGTFTWSGSGLPDGLGLSASGTLSGTPTAAGNSVVAATVTDSNTGQTLTAKIPLTIAAATTTLKASPSNLTAGAGVGGTITGSFTASGGTAPYKFSTSGLPTGISLSDSGELSGSSSVAGTYTATVTVTDSAATPATATAHLTINIFGITSGSLDSGAATVFYTTSIAASGGTPPFVFSASGLPAGLSLSGNGALTGTLSDSGTVTFTIQASDSAGLTSIRTFSLTMAQAPVSAKSLSLPDGTVGAPYSGSLKASGGTAPYTWSLITGAPPAGLSLSSDGSVSGIPTAPGTTTIGVQVKDANGGVASGAVSITIAPAPVAISAAALPSGVVNFYYGPQIIDISGGVAPYTFSLSGALPTGLNLNGNVITGTPTAQGTFPFTVNVTDSAGHKANAQSSITIRPPASDLLLLSGSVGFSLAQGTNVLPGGQSVGVQSTVVSDSIGFTAAASPGADWLTVTGGGTTPGSVSIALNSAALSLPAGTNSAVVTVTCTSSTCQGKSQTIGVSLNISSPPPQLGVGDALLSFNSASTVSQPVQIQNIGGGTLIISSVTCGAPWCSVGSFSSSLTGGASTQVTITTSPTGLTSGFYRTSVNINSPAGNATIPVTFLVTQTATMTLAPSGAQFQMAAGGKPGNTNGSFQVTAAGGNITWSAASKDGASWLTLGAASGTSSSGSPDAVSYSINSSAASLTPGPYYATIEVTSPDAVNSPQDYQIVLNVAPSTDPPRLTVNPGGLTFSSTSTSQVVKVYSTSSTPTAYQASASTDDGGSWLSVTPTGNASSSAPGTATVSVKTTGLSAGVVYRGSVSFAAGSSGISTVNVTLIMPAGTPVPLSASAGSLAPRASCSAAKVVATQVGLVNSFSAPASWPTPLSVQLSDDCGNAINSGQVVATFSNGDAPLAFTLSDAANGVYSATWTPRASASKVTINARGTKTGLTAATAQLSGSVVPNAAPTIDPNGVVHPYDPLVGGSLSPGTIVAVYGSHLGSQVAQPSTIPLPTKLNGTVVLIGGVPSPLFYVSPGQINVQVPFELSDSQQYQVIVNANGALTPPQPIQLTKANPGLDTFPDGSLVAVHASDGTLISPTSPAKRGEYVVLFALGLGATDNPVASGDSSSGTLLSRVTVQPNITMNSNPVPITFAGLAPGFVGLYQVNLQIPADQPGGNVVVGVSQGDTNGNTGILPIAY